MTDPNQRDTKPDERRPLTFWEVLGSTLAAAIGVQKKVNKERDFTRGNPLHFILAGIIFTTLFVLAVVFVVKLVLSHAT